MTPYNLAVQLFDSGASAADVVVRLMNIGLDVSDARIAANAAAPQGVVFPELPAPPVERASPVRSVATPQSTPSIEEPIRPGFHGWLLVVTILHSIYAVVVVMGLGLHALFLPLVAVIGSPSAFMVMAMYLTFSFAAAAACLSGMVLLFQRRRAARKFLIAWTLCCLATSCYEQLFAYGSVASMAIPLLWLAYFTTSKQLRVTLTR